MNIDDIKSAAADITAATITSDPRLARSPHYDAFMTAARTHKMSIWARDEATKATLRPIFREVYNIAQDPSTRTVTRAFVTADGVELDIPQTLIDAGAEDEIRAMAATYAQLNKIGRFEIRPTTVLNLEPHDHRDDVLSVSWGGNGLIVRNGSAENQLREGDWGFLHQDLIHESPPRNFDQHRVVMVALAPVR